MTEALIEEHTRIDEERLRVWRFTVRFISEDEAVLTCWCGKSATIIDYQDQESRWGQCGAFQYGEKHNECEMPQSLKTLIRDTLDARRQPCSTDFIIPRVLAEKVSTV